MKYFVYAIIKAKNLKEADKIVDETSPTLKMGTLKMLKKDYDKE